MENLTRRSMLAATIVAGSGAIVNGAAGAAAQGADPAIARARAATAAPAAETSPVVVLWRSWAPLQEEHAKLSCRLSDLEIELKRGTAQQIRPDAPREIAARLDQVTPEIERIIEQVIATRAVGFDDLAAKFDIMMEYDVDVNALDSLRSPGEPGVDHRGLFLSFLRDLAALAPGITMTSLRRSFTAERLDEIMRSVAAGPQA